MNFPFRTTAKVLMSSMGIVVVLLLVAIWRIENMSDTIEDRARMGSGQIVRTNTVETERFIGESLSSWQERHMNAVRAFDRPNGGQ